MFDITKLDAGDGKMFTGANPGDKFDKDNLFEEVKLSEELATALDGKTIGEFQEILTENIKSGANVNFEMFLFGKDLFASYHNTGYENNQANNIISDLEDRASDNWLNGGAQGLSYDTEVREGECGTSPLPAALQPEPAEPEQPRTGYLNTESSLYKSLMD